MSAITDRARDFWDRISPRERILVILAGVATPIVLVIWLGSSISDGLDTMAARNQRTRKALAAVEDMRAKGEVKPPTDDSVAAMTTESLSLDTYIDHAAKAAKIELKSTITPHGEQHKNGFVTNSSSLRLDKIDIEQAKDFLNAIETGSKVVAVTQLELSPDFHDKDKLTLDIEISTYSKEPPPDSGSGADAGSAKKGN